MADNKILIPFILKSEGGWSNRKSDKGGETNKGITYTVWCSTFGANAHDRFMKMSPEDWGKVYKPLYWDKALGDQIKSQKIANIIVDWVWTSGQYYPDKHIQHILNTVLNKHLLEDGNFGQATIEALNSGDEEVEYKAIIKDRFDYIEAICRNDLKQEVNRQGWINRINNMISFNNKL